MLSLVLSLLVFRRRRVSDDYCVVVSCAVWVLVWAVVRPGRGAHLVFMVFGLATNMIVTAMLLLGGSAVVTALTGMSTTAACLLTPLGVIVYTLHGGIKATFVSDYLHTALIFAIIITFGFTVYATSPLIGSPDAMFGLLKAAVKVQHVVIKSIFVFLSSRAMLPLLRVQSLLSTALVLAADRCRCFATQCSGQRLLVCWLMHV